MILKKIKSFLKLPYKIVNQISRKITIKKLIYLSKNFIDKKEYKLIKTLGRGKDGIVYLVSKNNQEKVLKYYSKYGKKNINATKLIFPKISKIDELIDVKFFNKYYSYNNIKLNSIDLRPENLFSFYKKIIDFQLKLINQNIIHWDWGLNHINFMYDTNGFLKLIDYGGNGFLPLEKDDLFTNRRKNLKIANDLFLKQYFVLHIINWGIGKKKYNKLATKIQFSNNSYNEIISLGERLVKGSSFENLMNTVLEQDLTRKSGWINLKKIVEAHLNEHNYIVLEKADIDSVSFGKDEVHVSGYQNYFVSKNKITPIKTGHKWTVSETKYNIVRNSFKKINPDTGYSYIDIGCNLGMYLFMASLEFKLTNVSGVDYNKNYINNILKISNFLDLKIDAQNKKFSEINEKFDIVSCLGIIHHLYSRTEKSNSLLSILENLKSMSNKFLILEFPTEGDSKAKDWTEFSSDVPSNDYSYENFKKIIDELFQKNEIIGKVSDHRPVYLLTI